MLKTSLLTLSAFFLASIAFAQAPPDQSPLRPPVDGAKLPPNLRNLPLDRMSSGALMLLNRDNNLVLPPRSVSTAKGGTTAEKAASGPVALDPRIGSNIRLGNDPAPLPSNMRAQAEPHIAGPSRPKIFWPLSSREGRFATGGGAVDCGYSVSHDGGLAWTRALIPNLTMASGGPYFRATDPVVAFDLNNNVYLETLVATSTDFDTGTAAVVLSKSTDGGATFGSPNYTAVVRGINATSGAALLEVHDLEASSTSLISNLSTRGLVGTGANVMIGGLIVGGGLGTNGDGSSEVLVRVLGPQLTGLGIADALQDPMMELHDGNGNILATNDNWKESQQAAIQATGLAPGDDREPAILTTFIQGSWTAIVRGKNNTTGVGLMEVYRIH
jgi:hypothetical protein